MKTDENNKIVECTENELFDFYLKRGYDDLFSFTDYMRQCEELGTVVIKNK